MVELVLIHGAWAGAWVWDLVLPELQARGVRPHPVDLPGNGHHPAPETEVSLAAYTAHVLRLIENIDTPVVLAAHSGGGVVATQVAERAREQVPGVAYVAGMMLPPRVGFRELVASLLPQHPEATGIGPYLTWSADGYSSRVPAEAARELFFHDAAPALAATAAARLTGQPEKGRALRAHWTAERFGTLPRLYIETLRDRSVVLAAQRRMQALVLGAEVVSMNTGHVPQLSAPADLARHLAEFSHRVSGASGVLPAIDFMPQQRSHT